MKYNRRHFSNTFRYGGSIDFASRLIALDLWVETSSFIGSLGSKNILWTGSQFLLISAIMFQNHKQMVVLDSSLSLAIPLLGI